MNAEHGFPGLADYTQAREEGRGGAVAGQLHRAGKGQRLKPIQVCPCAFSLFFAVGVVPSRNVTRGGVGTRHTVHKSW